MEESEIIHPGPDRVYAPEAIQAQEKFNMATAPAPQQAAPQQNTQQNTQQQRVAPVVAAATRAATHNKGPYAEVEALLRSRESELMALAPREVPWDLNHNIQLVVGAMSKSEKLAMCSKESIYKCFRDCAAIGLEPNSPFQECCLVPYKMKNDKFVCQVQIMYQGFITLLLRTKMINDIAIFLVFEGDKIDVDLGRTRKIRHQPCLDSTKRGKFYMVWGMALLASDPTRPHYDYMLADDVAAIENKVFARCGGKGRYSGPWTESDQTRGEMWKKTLVKRMAKMLPKSISLLRAEQADDEDPEELDLKPVQGITLPTPVSPVLYPLDRPALTPNVTNTPPYQTAQGQANAGAIVIPAAGDPNHNYKCAKCGMVHATIGPCSKCGTKQMIVIDARTGAPITEPSAQEKITSTPPASPTATKARGKAASAKKKAQADSQKPPEALPALPPEGNETKAPESETAAAAAETAQADPETGELFEGDEEPAPSIQEETAAEVAFDAPAPTAAAPAAPAAPEPAKPVDERLSKIEALIPKKGEKLTLEVLRERVRITHKIVTPDEWKCALRSLQIESKEDLEKCGEFRLGQLLEECLKEAKGE